jgi:hypothetical protein
MWVVVHALSGLALGVAAPLALGLVVVCSLALHLLLDLVPHWDYTAQRHALRWALADVLAAIAGVVVLSLVFDPPGRAVVSAVVSALPDLDVFDAVMPGRRRRRWFPSHWQRFPHGQTRAAWGVPIQGAVVAASMALTALLA